MASETPFFDITLHKMVCSKGDFSMLYELTHINGQLIATFIRASHVKRGTEVFIKNLPPDVLLQDIFELVFPMGQIYQIRILLEFSGHCRGYCYVNFFEIESARKSMIVLCGKKIKESAVVVKMSFDNNKLEIQNIPKNRTPEQIFKEVSNTLGMGLKDIFFVSSKNNTPDHINCVLTYSSHKNALEARKKVFEGVQLFGEPAKIDWAIPEEKIKSKRLYFDFPTPQLTKPELYEELIKIVKPKHVLNIFLQDGVGYITFQNESIAYESFKMLKKIKIHGQEFRLSFRKFYGRLPTNNISWSEKADSSEKQVHEKANHLPASYESNRSCETSGSSSFSSNEDNLMPTLNSMICPASFPFDNNLMPVLPHEVPFTSSEGNLVPVATLMVPNPNIPNTQIMFQQQPMLRQVQNVQPTLIQHGNVVQQVPFVQQGPLVQQASLVQQPLVQPAQNSSYVRELHPVWGMPYTSSNAYEDPVMSQYQNQYEAPPIRIVQLNSSVNNLPINFCQMTQDFYNQFLRQ